MIHTDLISFFTSTNYAAKDIAAKVGNRCHYTYVPKSQSNTFPRLYLERTDSEDIGYLDGSTPDYVEDSFSLEVISNKSSDIDAIVNILRRTITPNPFYGPITATKNVKGIFVENQQDEYEPKGIGNDVGVDYAAFNLRVIHDGQ